MKTTKILSIAAVAAVAVALTAFISKELATKSATNNKGFAVIELFTSEGCSSCPPADALVAKIEKESGDKPIYILAYHVDYWNSPAWKDQFSSADFSKRQREYAKILKLQSVYTPQVVVNGNTEFVGSEEGRLRKAISSNLQNTSAVQISLSAANIGQKKAALKYTIAGADKHTVLQIAVIEKTAASKVAGGENGGRTLTHVQIVHKLQQVTLEADKGAVNIELPAGFDAKNWEIIGFLQNESDGCITGAARASLTANSSTTAVIKSTK